MSDPARASHPSVEKLRTFGLGQLDEGEASAVEEHVSRCEACCRTLAEVRPDTLMGLLRQARKPPESSPDSDTAALTLPPAGAGGEGRAGPGLPPELADHPRYRVLALLGSGGMGAVYKAEHRLMERVVALKVMAADLVSSPAMVERFRREVRAAARLAHPNIVAAHDAEQAGGLHLLVMEYVEGTDLARVVVQRGPLPVGEACDYARQAAAGLQHAHEHGMIHRDIKPHNLMLTPQGVVKILDFGLALLAGEAGSQPGAGTAQGTVLGTVDYMAPEQADDAHRADIRSDIYSLGCTLYHLLSGRPPFPQGTIVQKIMAHTERSATPLRELRPDVPPGLARVVERMMAKRPGQRYQTPAEVARALEPFAEPAVAVVEAPAPPLRRSPRRSSAGGRTEQLLDARPRKARPRRRWPVALGLAALLLGGLIAVAGAVYRIKTDSGVLVISTDNPDVEVVIKQNGKEVRVIDTKTGKEVRLDSGFYELKLGGKAEGLKLSLERVTIRRGETVVATVERRPIEAAEEKVGEVRRFTGHTGTVRGVAYSPDGKFVLSCSGWPVADNTARLWDVATGKEVRRLEHPAAVISVAFSPDGRYALSGGDDHIMRLWEVATGKEIRRFEGHERGAVYAVAFSPDGRQALSAGEDGTVRLWDVKTGEELRKFAGHEGQVFSVAFSPDGRRAASGGEGGTIRLWDVETGKELKRFDIHGKSGVVLAYSPDGRSLLAGYQDATVRLWDVETGQEVRSFLGHTVGGICLAFSKDGRRALTGSPDTTVRLWDVETGKELHCFRGHRDTVWGVAFSPDGRYAVSGSGGSLRNDKWSRGRDWTVRLWRLPAPPKEKVGEVRRFGGQDGGIIQVALSPDGRLAVSGNADHTAILWDVATGKELHKLEGHTNQVYAVAFRPNGRQVLTGSEDNLLKLWDVDSGKEVRTFEGHTGIVTGVAFSPDGKRALSGSQDRTLRLWDVETGKELRKYEGHTDGVQSVTLSPDGRRAASGSFDQTVRLWDVETGKELRKFEGHTAMVRSVAYSRDGRRLLSGAWEGDGTLRLWDVETGRELRKMDGIPEGIHGVALSPDGRRALAAGMDADVQLWDLETGQLLYRLKGHAPPSVTSAVFSADGRYALSGGGSDKTVRLWRLPAPPKQDAASAKPSLPPAQIAEDAFNGSEGVPAHVLCVTFSPDGRYFLAAGDAGKRSPVRVYDGKTGKRVSEFVPDEGAGWSGGVFSPDGSKVVSWFSNSKELYLSESATGKQLRKLEGHSETAHYAAFSPDGKRIVSGAQDKTLRVWDAETGKHLLLLEGHTDDCRGCFSPDGKWIVSTGADNTVRGWDAATGKEVWKHSEQALGDPLRSRLCCFSPDGARVLSLGGEAVVVSDVATGKEAVKLKGPAEVIGASFLPDGRRLMTWGKDKVLRVWDVATGKEVRSLELGEDLDTNQPGKVALSPDGRLLVTVHHKTVRVRDLATGKELHHYTVKAPEARSPAISPDSRFCAAGTWRGWVYLWRLPAPPGK